MTTARARRRHPCAVFALIALSGSLGIGCLAPADPARTVVEGPDPVRVEKQRKALVRAHKQIARDEKKLAKLEQQNRKLREYLSRAADVYAGEERERLARLEREYARLQADLAQAEDAFRLMESGLRGVYTRAEAISALAEARVRVQRASQLVSEDEIKLDEARAKLDDAERQLKTRAWVASVFFASRARRLAEELIRESSAPAASAPLATP